MRYVKLLLATSLALLFLSIFALNSFGQVTINPAGPLKYHVFLVADLGLQGGGKGNKDFTITFSAGPSGSQSITVDVYDDLTSQLLVSGQTNSFDYSQIQGTYYIGQIDDKFGGDFEVVDQAEDLYNKVLATGALPRGRFRIRVGLTPNGSFDELVVNIVPPYLQPLFPVDLQVNRAVLNFRWVSNISRQELHVYSDPFGNKEVLKGDRLPFRRISGGGVEEATAAQQVEGSFIAPVLDDGEIYYWQIWGRIVTSHGDELRKGTLTAFQYFEEAEKMAYIGLSDPDKQAIKDTLIELLEKIVNKRAARSIQEYDVNRVVLDNSPVTREEIMTILKAIIDEELTATSVRFQ